jgi:hypothetical protein
MEPPAPRKITGVEVVAAQPTEAERGDRVMLVLNGKKTIDVRDSKHPRRWLALQRVAGTIKFRRVTIRLR